MADVVWFEAGETVILSLVVRDDLGAFVDPATSMKITIRNPMKAEVVAPTNMVKDSTGKYHYDFQAPSAGPMGTWVAEYNATNGTRITITRQEFGLG